jgi:ankyrin repeat protein
MKHGGKRGKEHDPLHSLPPNNVSDDEFRLFYASFQNNVFLL